jgi:hypothetical protein
VANLILLPAFAIRLYTFYPGLPLGSCLILSGCFGYLADRNV